MMSNILSIVPFVQSDILPILGDGFINNTLSFYKQEFEFIASFLAGLFLLKVYMNE